MPLALLSAILLALFTTCTAQSKEALAVLYNTGQFTAALDMCSKMLNVDSTAAFANSVAGRANADLGNYNEAVPYLQLAIRLDGDKSYISGWSYAYLGLAYMKTGKTQEGKENLRKCIDLAKTENSVKYAQRLLKSGIAGDEQKSWPTIETEQIIYHFQDTAGWGSEVQDYIEKHNWAYSKIDWIFHAKLPQKLSLYVWNDGNAARQMLGRELGFSTPRKCLCQLHRNQTIGHEMTHVLSYWGWGERTTSSTRTINEGVAVCFDQRKNDKMEVARKALEGSGYHSILDIWKNDFAIEESVLYPAVGAFVSYLYQHSTPEQFKSIIKKQTLDNTITTYGKDAFDNMVREFDGMVGLK